MFLLPSNILILILQVELHSTEAEIVYNNKMPDPAEQKIP